MIRRVVQDAPSEIGDRGRIAHAGGRQERPDLKLMVVHVFAVSLLARHHNGSDPLVEQLQYRTDSGVGDLIQNKKIKEGTFLLVSGRVSYEIITKAFFAKIGTIVAVSACSSLAVDYAKEFGICLIGFSRESKATIYSNP